MDKRREAMPKFLFPGIFLLLLIGVVAVSGNQARAVLADHVVINEVSIDSKAGTGGSDDDWVELYNQTGDEVNLNGWSIQKSSGATTSSITKITLSGMIPAHGYFLIVKSSASSTLVSQANATSSSLSLTAGNIVYLVKNDTTVTDPTDANIVDFVGFGTASFHEGATAAPAIPEGKSIARIPTGADTDQNSIDFQVQNFPTPMNSRSGRGGMDGKVVFTVSPDIEPVQNIVPNGADIVFQTNANGTAQIRYGLDSSYSNSTAMESVAANTDKTIGLIGLLCATTYHYAIYAESSGGEHDQTDDATFTTLSCTGIGIDSIVMTKTSAKGDNKYEDGWRWEFNLTIFNSDETSLKMKFNQWKGAGILNAGGNMRYSANGETWANITGNNVYPAAAVDLSEVDDLNPLADGRQVKIIVEMKALVGTPVGYYNSSFGILTQ
jgi:hypothetical protein